MSKVKVAQSTDIPGFAVAEVFPSIEGMGYDGVDYLSYIRNFYKRPKKILELSEKHKLPIISIHQPKPFVAFHPKIFFAHMIELLTYFPDAKISNYHLSGFMNILKRKPSAIEKFIEIAKARGNTVTFESNPYVFTRLYPKEVYVPDMFGEFCIRHHLSITFDTSHIADNGYDIVTFFKKYHKNISMIHLSDFHNGKEHLPLGLGSLPIKKLLQEIKNTSWNKLIVFEIKRFPGARNKKEKLEHLQKSLDMVRKYTA